METREELEEQIGRLTQAVNEMRIRMARLEGSDGASDDAAKSLSSRRRFLSLGAGAALGAVGLAAARALPAGAANGNPVNIGTANSGTLPTTLQSQNAPNQVLGVESGDFSGSALTASGETFSGPLQGLGGLSVPAGPNNTPPAILADGVDGWAQGPLAFGVYGLTDAGVGVTGESSTGVGLYARSSGRIQQDAHSLVSGVPDYTPGQHEQVRDASGTLWLSNSAGHWRRASTFEVFGNPRRVYGSGVAIPPARSAGDPLASVTGIDATTQIAGSPWNGNPSGVPAGAVAAWCAVQAYEAGVLSIYPNGATDPGKANWAVQGTAGQGVNMLYMMVPLDSSGKFSFTNYFTTKHVYIDVWGFLSASAA